MPWYVVHFRRPRRRCPRRRCPDLVLPDLPDRAGSRRSPPPRHCIHYGVASVAEDGAGRGLAGGRCCSSRLESALNISARSSSVLRHGLSNLENIIKWTLADRRSIQGDYPWQIQTHSQISININVSSGFCITYGTYPEVLPLLLLQTVYLPNLFLRLSLSLSIHPRAARYTVKKKKRHCQRPPCRCCIPYKYSSVR